VAGDEMTVEQILRLLAATPVRMAEMVEGLTPVLLRGRLGPDEWSATEVLAHLRACADMWGGAIATILAGERATIRAINPRTWMTQTDYPALEFQPSFQAFRTQRAELLAVLEPLPPGDWLRSATVTGAGKPLVRSVQDYAQWLARHEQPHIKQIGRIVRTLREE
jgi:hypothetical protein